MIITIKAPGFEPLGLNSEIPAGLVGYYVPGSKVMGAVAGFGKLMLQLVELDGSGWLYSVFDITEDATFLIRSLTPLVLLRVILEGYFNYATRPTGTLFLKEGQYHISYLNELYHTLLLARGRHISLDIIYPPDTVLQPLDFFPVFEAFKKAILQRTPSLLGVEEMHATAAMMDDIHTMIHAPFSSNVRKFHLDIIKDLLFKSLQQASTLSRYHPTFSLTEVERIYAAKAFIDSHAPAHFSIFQIARRAGINDQKLKKGFREIFGTGLYGYLKERILEIAKIEIEQTDRPIKEIGAHAGYRNANNFSAAFKKRFGLTPLDWRKQYGER